MTTEPQTMACWKGEDCEKCKGQDVGCEPYVPMFPEPEVSTLPERPRPVDKDVERTEGDIPFTVPLLSKRIFETGAYRDRADGKLSYLRHLSPRALKRYVEYLDKCRRMPDGTMREPDNWKQGMPKREYAESMLRHVMDFWEATEEPGEDKPDVEELVCAILFNAFGYLHEELRRG